MAPDQGTEELDRQNTNKQTDEDTTMSKHYAHGVFRRMAEGKYDQTRRRDLTDYDQHPTMHEVVDDMIEHGYDEAVARSSAQSLWDDEIYDHAR